MNRIRHRLWRTQRNALDIFGRATNPSHTFLRQFWYARNVGDVFGALLTRRLFQRSPIWVPKHSESKLLSVGSILHFATHDDIVFGSGLLSPDYRPDLRRVRILALRGPLSAEVMAPGYSGPFGDPGLLVAGLLGITAAPVEGRIGVVRHHLERSKPLPDGLSPNFVDIDVHASPAAFLRQVSFCETVISTSLHGLVAADSLGIPRTWMESEFSARIGRFKFKDYFYGIGAEVPKLGSKFTPLPDLVDQAVLPSVDLALTIARLSEIHLTSSKF